MSPRFSVDGNSTIGGASFADEKKFEIVALGFPPFTTNTEVETVLEKIRNTYKDTTIPTVVKPRYRGESGLLRFTNPSDRKVFLQLLHTDPPKDLSIGGVPLKLNYKHSESKEERARTKEVRWWGWALGRPEILGNNAQDRSLLDTDKGRLVVLVGNKVVGGFFDAQGKPLRGPLDRSKFSFNVDIAAMTESFVARGIHVDITALTQEFKAAMKE